MAYVLKYKLELKGKDRGANLGMPEAVLNNQVFEIYELDPANSTVVSLVGAYDDSIRVSQNANKGELDFQYISSSCSISFLKRSDANLATFYTEDERKFYGILKRANAEMFRGWLFIDFSDESFNANNGTVILRFSDGIDSLADVPYLNEYGRKYFAKASVIEILNNINKKIGLEAMWLKVGTNMNQKTTLSGSTYEFFENIEISQLRFIGMSCLDVLKHLCTAYYAHFFQRSGYFWFVPFNLMKQDSKLVADYPYGTTTRSTTNTITAVKEISTDILMGEGSAFHAFKPPYNTTKISTQFSGTDLFENGLLEYYTAGASEPVFQIKALNGIESEENNITNEGWANVGTFKLSLLKFSESYFQQKRAIWYKSDGPIISGQFPQNRYVYVVEKGKSTIGAFYGGSKADVKKGSILNFSFAYGLDLRMGIGEEITNYAAFYLSLEDPSGNKYFLSNKGKWLYNNEVAPLGSTRYIQTIAHNGVQGPGLFASVNSLSFDSEMTPINGKLQLNITFPTEYNGSNGIYQFQSPIVTVKSQPKGITKITYETQLTSAGKHTVNDVEYIIPFCDNSLTEIPCSVFDQDGNETQRFTQGDVKDAHLISTAILERAVQFSKHKTKFRIDKAISHNVKICDIVTFKAADLPEFAGKRFFVTHINDRRYSENEMQITGIEIIESGELSLSIYYIDDKGIKQFITSDNVIDIGGTPTYALNSPWVWNNITNTTGSAYSDNLNNANDFVITATGDDIWGLSDNFGFLNRTGDIISALECKLEFPIVDSGGGSLDDFSKIGVMFRDSIAANSRHFSVVRQKNGFITVLYRPTTGANTVVLANLVNKEGITKLKLDYDGTSIIALYFDGSVWMPIITQQMTFADTALLGFCFAMKGDTASSHLSEVIYDPFDSIVTDPLKPTNLVGLKVSSKAEVTASGNPFNKPTGMTARIASKGAQIDSTVTITPPIVTGTGLTILNPETNGIQLLNDNLSVYQNQMKIKIGNTSSKITDEYWSFNPNSETRAWKIGKGAWRFTNLEDFVIPACYNGKEIMITKILYGSTLPAWDPNPNRVTDIYFPRYVFFQQIKLTY